MTNESLQILKTFTRKLANCRYKVGVNNVVKYMDEGRFGYTSENGVDSVITNDLVFADDIATVLMHIRAIFKEPHIFLKKEEIIQNISVATSMDNASLQKSYRDDKLWKVKDGDFALEYAHAYVHEDNLAIYENCFVVCIVDYLYDTINKKISELCVSLDSLNNKICGQNVTGLPAKDYVDYADDNDGMPVLISSNNPLITTISSLIRSKKQIESLKMRPLYKACKKAKPFILKNVKLTNILIHDKEYNYVYTFYKNYLNRSPVFTTEAKMYEGFIQVNLMVALSKLGFIPDEEAKEIVINNSANLKFENLTFVKDPFTVSISSVADGTIKLHVVENVDNNFADYYFKTVTGKEEEFLGKFEDVNAYATYLNDNLEEDFYGAFVFTDLDGASHQNVVNVVAEKSDALDKVIQTVKACLYVVEGAKVVYTRFCPVCGSTLISPIGNDINCSNCESVYHIYPYENKDIIWLKKLPKVTASDNRAIRIDNEAVEVQEIVETVEEPVELVVETVDNAEANDEIAVTDDANYKESIKKSFTAKMCQSDDKVKDLYNQLKNHLLSYKRVYTRISWGADTFSSGRLPRIKLAVRGKTLVAFFALNPDEYVDSKFYVHDMGDTKKYEDTPLMIKIKSDRGLKQAMELADILFNGIGLEKKRNFVEEAYTFPAKTDEELISEGLAKYITIKL